jgi:hypothetical protein
MTLNSVGSIATFIVNTFQVSTGISGNMIDLVEANKQFVSNYCGVSISSNSIPDAYQGAILDFSRADVVDLINAQTGGESISLGEFSMDDKGELLSASEYRILGDLKLKALGRKINFAKSLS